MWLCFGLDGDLNIHVQEVFKKAIRVDLMVTKIVNFNITLKKERKDNQGSFKKLANASRDKNKDAEN